MNDNSKKVKIRCLKVEANFYTHLMKTSIPSRRKVLDPHEENFAENNTINNISLSQIFDATSTDAINEQIKGEKPSTICTTKNCDGGVKNKKIFSADSDPYLLALFLENNILKNNPKFPQSESGHQRWAKDLDLMIRRDKIDADDIDEVIEWCQKDKFWRSNILYGKKLRDIYQQLRMKMISG